MPRTPLEEPLPIESWFDTQCLDSSELRCALRQWGERVSVVVGAEVAIGRILNADFANEMAILTKSMVLAEAANQVLAGSQLSKSNLVKLLK